MPDTPPPLPDDSTTPPTPAAAHTDPVATTGTEPPRPAVLAAPSEAASALAEAAPAPPDLTPTECAARLAELFPALFALAPNTPPRPIKLRIQADIQQRAPGLFTRRSLSPFLHRHTTSTAYLKALIASPHRFDLDGAPAGEVSDEHRRAAIDELDRRRALHEARRAAQRRTSRGGATPQGTAPDVGAESQARPEGMAPASPPGHARPPRARDRDDPRPANERAPRPPRPPRPPRQPARTRPEREADGGADPRRVANPASQTVPTADDSARRERALLLRAFESSTLSPANFCALKRVDPATLDAMLAQARSEAAPQQPSATRNDAQKAAPRRPAR